MTTSTDTAPLAAETTLASPHLLVPLANHSKAGAGLEFITHFFTNKGNVRMTLMHIPPSQAAVWAEELSYENLDALETQTSAADKKGRVVIDHAKRTMVAAGFEKDRIADKIGPAQMTKAHDIIREAVDGRYDAVVLGRRTQQGLGDILDQSICREFIESLSNAISFPLWLCRLPEPGRKNVLLCVDDSDPSDRIADHVGYMLSLEPGHTVTVFRVYDPVRSSEPESAAIVDHAVGILLEAGLPRERIRTELRRGSNPARRIQEEYDSGNYAAVAIGSAGAGRGFWNKLFIGSVAQTLFKELHGAALWICY